MSFWRELRRRNVIKVAVAYAVVAWVLAQITSVFAPALHLPSWVTSFVAFILIIGFPLALILSWAYELTPEGIKKVREVPLEDTVSHVVRAARGVVKSTDVPEESSRSPAENSQQRSAASPSASPKSRPKILRNSVAVLPLENLSPNPDHAYFAAGIHEEILNYLTKIKDVSVIARTSVKKYADTQKSISEIAKELGVGTVMEGSVRYSGKKVRVTAQLIDAATDEHLWSEVYERDLSDVFAIQVDVAEKIAGALKAELSVDEKKGIQTLPTTSSSEAHQLYLRAQALFGQNETAIAVTTPPRVRARIQSYLDQVIELDPAFANPYALKALLYAVSKLRDPIGQGDWLKRCRELDEAVRSNVEKALSLNSNLGIPHFARALNHQVNWRGTEAREAYERALDLKPNDSEILTWYATLEWSMEHFDNAIRLGEKAVALDPGNTLAELYLGCFFHAAGDYDAAVDAFLRASELSPHSAYPYQCLAMSEVALHRNSSALVSLGRAERSLPDDIAPTLAAHCAYGYGRLGQREDAQRVVNRIKRTIGDRFVDPKVRVWTSSAIGDHEQALQWLHEAVEKTEQRSEIFVRTFIKQNSWFDTVFDRPEFAEMRSRLSFS